MRITLLLFLSSIALTAQSGGHVGGPTDAELWNSLSTRWVQVTSFTPEALPKSTPRKEAEKLIEKADAARGAFLKTKESLYRTQAARLKAMSALLADASGTYESRELAVAGELQGRIDAATNALRALEAKQDRQSLAEAAAIRSFREKLDQLLSTMEKNARTSRDSDKDAMEAQMARQRAIAALDADGAAFESLAESTASERLQWHVFYQNLPQRFCGEEQPCSEKR